MEKDTKYTLRLTSEEKKDAEILALKLGLTQLKNRGKPNEKEAPNLSKLYRALVKNSELWSSADHLTNILILFSKQHANLARLATNINTLAHTYNKMNLSYSDINVNDYPLLVSEKEIIENKKLLKEVLNETKKLRSYAQRICAHIKI